MKVVTNKEILDELKRSFFYDPETGVMARVDGRRGSSSITSHGYMRVSLLGKHRYVHRMAILYMTGEMPVGEVDHINGDGADNRLCNLRVCGRSGNNMNRGLFKSNKLGVKNVRFDAARGKYRVSVANKYVGRFDTIDEAVIARDIAIAQHTDGIYEVIGNY